MATTFEIAARAAIEEIVQKHGKESKFGMIIPKEAVRDLVDDIYILLQTSRTLKSAGDKFLRDQALASPSKPGPQKTR